MLQAHQHKILATTLDHRHHKHTKSLLTRNQKRSLHNNLLNAKAIYSSMIRMSEWYFWHSQIQRFQLTLDEFRSKWPFDVSISGPNARLRRKVLLQRNAFQQFKKGLHVCLVTHQGRVIFNHWMAFLPNIFRVFLSKRAKPVQFFQWVGFYANLWHGAGIFLANLTCLSYLSSIPIYLKWHRSSLLKKKAHTEYHWRVLYPIRTFSQAQNDVAI